MLRFSLLVVIFGAVCSGAHQIQKRSIPNRTVIGGDPGLITDYPYQVSLEFFFSHHCGATIISEDWVLTAAHCVNKHQKLLLRVRAGTSFHGRDGTLHYIDTIVIHPKFDPESVDYDIAVIKVQEPFKFDETTKPLKLASKEEHPVAGEFGTVTGWGVTKFGSKKASTQLLHLDLPVVDDTQCNKDYEVFDGVTPRMFCAGYPQGEKDVCQGESGGPLVSKGVLIGIVSWGVECGKPGYPGVYTKVSELRDWIKEQTGV